MSDWNPDNAVCTSFSSYAGNDLKERKKKGDTKSLNIWQIGFAAQKRKESDGFPLGKRGPKHAIGKTMNIRYKAKGASN